MEVGLYLIPHTYLQAIWSLYPYLRYGFGVYTESRGSTLCEVWVLTLAYVSLRLLT